MPELNELIPLPEPNPALLEFLENRRSNLVKLMEGPGPDKEQLMKMLTIAARVPDHRKLSPWRFIIIEDEARDQIGQHIGKKFKADNPDLPDERIDYAAGLLKRAPTVVAVVSSPKDCHRGTPKWEQQLSSAIVCYNLCLAAQGFGFGAQWLTEWIAYDPEVLKVMRVSNREKVAGFIYIGKAAESSKERPRPDIGKLTYYWT